MSRQLVGTAVVTTAGEPHTYPRPGRVSVVIAVEPDGFITCYAPGETDIRFVGLLKTEGPEERTLAEAYATARLPIPHRGLVFDGRFSRASYMPKPTTAEQELTRRLDLLLLRDVQQAQGGRQ